MKIGRNEKCPCGSGKKYKQCCLNSDEQIQSKINKYPEQYFGYVDTKEISSNEHVLNDKGLVCMVSNVTGLNRDAIKEDSGQDFQFGEWFFSTGAHEDTIVHGPFKDQDSAFNSARKFTGAKQFKD